MAQSAAAGSGFFGSQNRGEENYGYGGHAAFLSNLGCNRAAVHFGHDHVQENQIWTEIQRCKPSLARVVLDGDFIRAGGLQGAFERLREYDAILLEQPEIFIDSESKYTGMKPDHMKILADSFLEILALDVEQVFSVTDKPGPRVLHMRVALSGLYLKKKHSKNPLAYTPAGFALHGVKKALTSDITKKISLVEVTIEAEILDSQTLERFAAVVVRRGTHKDKDLEQKREPSSWGEVEEVMSDLGSRLACRLSNSRKLKESWMDCRSAAAEAKAD